MGILLQEYSPRPWSFAYIWHRFRTVIRVQGSWFFPVLLAFFYAIFAIFAVGQNVDEVTTATLFFTGLGVGFSMFLAGRAAFLLIAARLYPFLDTHPQSQEMIKNGYQLPEKPDALGVVLGEMHPEREYTAGGSYTLKHSVGEVFSPTPEWTFLPVKSLVTGLLVLGGIGSGKTAFVLRPSVFKMFHHPTRVGGLVMDSKASLVEPLLAELFQAGRFGDYLPIGPETATLWNPLHQPLQSPATIASSLTTALENVRGQPYSAEAAWIKDGAGLLVEGGVGLLRLANSGYVTPFSLKSLLTTLQILLSGAEKPGELAKDYLAALCPTTSTTTAEDKEKYEFYSGLIISVFNQDEKFRGIYLSEVFTLLIPLTAPGMNERFSPPEEKLNCPSWSEIINQGKIVVLDCNNRISPNLSVILGMLLKLGYQDAMLARPAWVRKGLCDADRPMALIIDEYQEFASPGDANYLALCRESKSMSIFLTQGFASIIQRVGEPIANVIIQSLRNRLVLTCPSPKFAAELLGEREVEEIDKNISESIQDASLHATGKFAGQSSVSESLSVRRTRKHFISPEELAALPTGQGILQSHDGDRAIPIHRVFLIPHYLPDHRHVDYLRSNKK